MSRHGLAKILVAALLCSCQSATAQSNDPPSRVGRVSSVNGSVSLMLAGETEWRNASLNYPLTTADALWTDAAARAELHIGASAIHLADETSLALDAIEDNLIQLRVGQGSVHVRLRAISQQEDYEIDTPAGAILLRTVGDYRVDVTPDGQRTTVTVRDGNADVMIGNSSYPVQAGTSVTLTASQPRPMASYRAIPTDSWEQWADMRNRRGDASPSTRYVSREMVGYEDLDQYGDWQVDAAYGPTWYPRSMSADWAPYRNGRWESVDPWGWTWIDEEPWGFAPFHYGRWSNHGGRWGWTPGNMVARPVYAPALVAFVSGSNWNVSLSFGSNGGVGWVPLGPQEVYVPSYRASPTYIRNVNITNVNVTNINVNNVHYVNRSIPGAVTAVPRDVFMGSRPVRQAAVRVQPTDLAAVRVSVAPIADNTPVAPPRRGSAMDRARPDNAGTIRQPPVELKRSPNPPAAGRDRTAPQPQAPPMPVSPTQPPVQDRGRKQPDQQQQPPVTAPPTQGRGRGQTGQQQVPVTPPAAIPTPPPGQDRGRGQAGRQQPVTPPAAIPTPPPVKPPVIPPSQTQNRGRGRAGQQQAPVTPPAASPTPPPVPDRGGKQAVPQPPVTPPPTQGRGRGQADPQPPQPPVKSSDVIPPPPPAQDRGRQRADPQPPPTAPVVIPTPPPAKPVVNPTPPPAPDRGRKQPNQPTPPAPKPDVPPPPVPVAPQGGGRAIPTQPTAPVGRGRTTPPDTGRGGKPAKPPKQTKTKPDTGRGGGVPSLQVDYQL